MWGGEDRDVLKLRTGITGPATLKYRLEDEMISALIEAAKGFRAHHIQLTSNPRRVAANRLYQAMGFERYETNCYKLEIAGPGPR